MIQKLRWCPQKRATSSSRGLVQLLHQRWSHLGVPWQGSSSFSPSLSWNVAEIWFPTLHRQLLLWSVLGFDHYKSLWQYRNLLPAVMYAEIQVLKKQVNRGIYIHAYIISKLAINTIVSFKLVSFYLRSCDFCWHSTSSKRWTAAPNFSFQVSNTFHNVNGLCIWIVPWIRRVQAINICEQE